MGIALGQRIHLDYAPAGVFDPAYLSPPITPPTTGEVTINVLAKRCAFTALTLEKWESVRLKGYSLL